ncbi:transmembrane protein 42 [Culex quinquefasciatus]|uniref:transmembrane protein 42 n=1 Tax=Culex quinquefasciatus TaxID=7176 RepID=UPI0018E3523C|nr:transmembrane protein 42 [Culex quinquefasciatus]
MSKPKPYFAIISGLCASSASFFGKLSSLGQEIAENAGYKQFELLAQIACIVIMVLLNACVWRFFVKALHADGGTLVAALVSAATNYTASALLGWFIFDERTSFLWWIGTALVLAGLLLIVNDDEQTKKKQS